MDLGSDDGSVGAHEDVVPTRSVGFERLTNGVEVRTTLERSWIGEEGVVGGGDRP